MDKDYQKQWEEFRDQELIKVSFLLEQLGFSLADKQVHIGGERYLTGARKLVLIGQRNSDNKKVVIKVSSDPALMAEIEDERNSRNILKKINFAYHVFNFPKEIVYIKKQGYLIFITEFIDQEKTFLERDLKEQFFIALKAFEAQEAIHATTYEHANIIRNIFGIWSAKDYLNRIIFCHKQINMVLNNNQTVDKVLQAAENQFKETLSTVDVYCNFLTHWDFVPHNFRVAHHDIYLLDHSSLRFGNKYEGWARFINFMTLHNPDLAERLVIYVQENRDTSELEALYSMRVFRLVELIFYYAITLEHAVGNLHVLNTKRIDFWIMVLDNILAGQPVDIKVIEEYKKVRDSLRSQEEKERQKKLH